MKSPLMSRRSVLPTLLAAGTTALTQKASAADTRSLGDDLTRMLAYEFPLKDEKKWGGHLKVQDYGCGKFRVVVENEEWRECPSGPDPSRDLTSFLSVRSCEPQVIWARHDGLSDLVSHPLDIDFIKVYSKLDPSFALNNLRNPVTDGFVPAIPLTVQERQFASSVGLGSGTIDNVCVSPFLTIEQDQMAVWMHGESDPHSKLHIYPIADSKNTDGSRNGHNVYRLDLYRTQKSSGSDSGTDRLVLAAMFDYATGKMTRIEEATEKGAPYSKIFAATFDKDGMWVKKYGIDNGDVKESQLYMPELEALMPRVVIQLPQVVTVGGQTTPGPTGPTPTALPGSLGALTFKAYQFENGPELSLPVSDVISGASRTVRYDSPLTQFVVYDKTVDGRRFKEMFLQEKTPELPQFPDGKAVVRVFDSGIEHLLGGRFGGYATW